MKSLVLLFAGLVLVLFSNEIFAKDFDLKNEVATCQKCHGLNFDKQVLNASKKISEFSKKELISSFEKYLKAPNGGKSGLMKIIIKKYSKEERLKIANYIYNSNK